MRKFSCRNADADGRSPSLWGQVPALACQAVVSLVAVLLRASSALVFRVMGRADPKSGSEIAPIRVRGCGLLAAANHCPSVGEQAWTVAPRRYGEPTRSFSPADASCPSIDLIRLARARSATKSGKGLPNQFDLKAFPPPPRVLSNLLSAAPQNGPQVAAVSATPNRRSAIHKRLLSDKALEKQ